MSVFKYYCIGCFIEKDCPHSNKTSRKCENPRAQGEELEKIIDSVIEGNADWKDHKALK